MVKRRGKKPTTGITSLRPSSNNNNGENGGGEEQLPAHFTNKQKSWMEKLNSHDPHQREDGCEDIITILSTSTTSSSVEMVDKMLQSLFQSGILITLVKLLITDKEPQVRVAATAALQNVAAVGGDVAIEALINMSIPSSENENNTTPFPHALLDVLGQSFQVLSDSVDHLKRYVAYLARCKEVGGRANLSESETVSFPKFHPEVPNKMLIELLGLCCVLAQYQQEGNNNNNNNNKDFAALLADSNQLLTTLTRTMIEEGFPESNNNSTQQINKYYPISTRENLATSCAELLYVLSNSGSQASTNKISNFFSNSVPQEVRSKFDALISASDPAVVEMITKSPSRLCVSLYAGGIFISCFPSQSLRITRLLTLCMKGESVINVTSQAVPLLSAQAVNERHHQLQEKLKQQMQQEENGNHTNNNEDEDDDEEPHLDDRDAQLRQGPFRSLKVFHTAFTLAHEVLNNIVAGEIPTSTENFVSQEDLDDAQFQDDNNDANGNNNNDEDDEANFLNSGAFNEFVTCGLIPASLSRCGEVIETPSDIVLRSALFDPSSNGHVMNLQSNFHSTVTAILSFNAALLMLLPMNTTQNPDPSTGLPSYAGQASMMWTSAFSGLNDRTNAINHIISSSSSSSNNNNNENASSIWSGTKQNIFLQIESLVSMVWTLERKTMSSPSTATLITPQPQQVDLLRALFFENKYQEITGDTRVAVTGCMGQIAVSAAKHDQADALQSCTKFLVEMLHGAVSKFSSNNNNNSEQEQEQKNLALDVAAEAADVLMDAFCDERFDKNVYKPQGVHRALQGFFPLLKPFASTKAMRRKGPRYQHLNGVYQNLGAFMEYKIQNGAV